MLGQRRRQRPNSRSALAQCLVFTAYNALDSVTSGITPDSKGIPRCFIISCRAVSSRFEGRSYRYALAMNWTCWRPTHIIII